MSEVPSSIVGQVGRTSEGAPHLRAYPAYKASGVPWLGDVPAHWKVLPGRACYREKKAPNTGLKETTVLSLSYGQIVVKPPEKLHGLVPASFETYQIVDPGDIIIRPTDLQNDWNSLRFGLSRHRGIITSAYMCFHTQDALTRDYGHLLLHTYDLMKIFYGLGSGLRQNLDWKDFKYLPCLAPPLAEQRAIAAFLAHHDRLTRRYIHAQQRLIKLLTEQKQALIQQAVTRGLDPDVTLKDSGIGWLGKIPAHWRIAKLTQLSSRISDGLHGTPQYVDESPYYFINGNNLVNGSISITEKTRCVSEGECRKYKPEIDDSTVLISINGTIGNIAYYQNEMVMLGKSVAYINCSDKISRRFLYYVLQSSSILNYFYNRATGTTILNLSLNAIRNTPIALPPSTEQSAIVDFLSTDIAIIEGMIACTQRQIALVREYRTRLIADVVTGKLDVRGFEVGRTSESAPHLDDDFTGDMDNLEDEATMDAMDDLAVEEDAE